MAVRACSFDGRLRGPRSWVGGLLGGRVIRREKLSATQPDRASTHLKERAVRMVREHGPEHPSQWAAITSIASKIGCTAETLRNWVRQAARDRGQLGGLTR